VAILAHWSRRRSVTRSVRELVRELQAGGYQVAVSSTSEVGEALAWGDEVDVGRLVVIRRPNAGYDFGSWSVALDLLPAAARAERTILLNDSMAGPFSSLRPILDGVESTPADVVGLTDTQQFESHLQSYFIAFCNGVLQEKALNRFWGGIRHEPDKTSIILRNELGLSHLLRVEGYVHAPLWSHELVVGSAKNPVIQGWRRLLDLGFPFVKRELLRDPTVAPGGRAVPRELRRRFGVEVAEWVDDQVVAA
jgi:lipopolysaccharide biosynthesis protein